MRSLRAAVVLAVAGATLSGAHGVAVICPTSGLLCTDLIPTPDLGQVTAVLEIMPVPSPFGVSVTVDGHPRQRLTMSIADLPAARSLGDYSVFVTWAYSVALDSAVKLGVVNNGRTELGELDYNQFRIIVSAEKSATVAARTGRSASLALSRGRRHRCRNVAASAPIHAGQAS